VHLYVVYAHRGGLVLLSYQVYGGGVDVGGEEVYPPPAVVSHQAFRLAKLIVEKVVAEVFGGLGSLLAVGAVYRA